jgi:hypothetical protein
MLFKELCRLYARVETVRQSLVPGGGEAWTVLKQIEADLDGLIEALMHSGAVFLEGRRNGDPNERQPPHAGH